MRRRPSRGSKRCLCRWRFCISVSALRFDLCFSLSQQPATERRSRTQNSYQWTPSRVIISATLARRIQEPDLASCHCPCAVGFRPASHRRPTACLFAGLPAMCSKYSAVQDVDYGEAT